VAMGVLIDDASMMVVFLARLQKGVRWWLIRALLQITLVIIRIYVLKLQDIHFIIRGLSVFASLTSVA